MVTWYGDGRGVRAHPHSSTMIGSSFSSSFPSQSSIGVFQRRLELDGLSFLHKVTPRQESLEDLYGEGGQDLSEEVHASGAPRRCFTWSKISRTPTPAEPSTAETSGLPLDTPAK